MEANINGVKCRNNVLEINIARHERKMHHPNNNHTNKPKNPAFMNQASISGRPAFVGRRTYGEVIGGKY